MHHVSWWTPTPGRLPITPPTSVPVHWQEDVKAGLDCMLPQLPFSLRETVAAR